MADSEFEKLDQLDRNALMDWLSENLIFISGKMGMTPAEIAWRAGINKTRMNLLVEGKRKMKWSEYLCILFVLWDDEEGRVLAEENGLFPDALKNVMALNRNAHEVY